MLSLRPRVVVLSILFTLVYVHAAPPAECDPKKFSLDEISRAAEQLFATQRPRQAIACFRAAYRANPDSASAAYNLAGTYMRVHDFPKAIKYFRKAASRKAKEPIAAAAYHLGNLYMRISETDRAIRAYQRAIELDARHASSHSGLASALASRGDHDQAAKHYRLAVDTDPKNADALFNAGGFFGNLGHFQDAAEMFRRAVELQPHDPEIHQGLGMALKNLDILDEAEQALRAAVARRPGLLEAQASLGQVLERQGKVDEAIDQLERAVDRHSGHRSEKLLMTLAAAQQRNASYDDAVNTLELAAAFFSSSAEILNNLAAARLLANSSDPVVFSVLERARSLAKRSNDDAKQLTHVRTLIHVNRARAYLVHGEPTKAGKEALKALQLEPTNRDVALLYAQALARSETSERQHDALRRALGLLHSVVVQKVIFERKECKRSISPCLTALRRAMLVDPLQSLPTGVSPDKVALALRRSSSAGAIALEDALKHSQEDHTRAEANLYEAHDRSSVLRSDARMTHAGERPSGVIVFLCCADESEFRDFVASISMFQHNVKAAHAYPIHVYHDGFLAPAERESALRAAAGPLQLRLESFAFEQGPGAEKAPLRLHTRDGHSWSMGYRNMCRFFSRQIFDRAELKSYDYVWRLDTDSFLFDTLSYDPIDLLHRTGKDYGYMTILAEPDEVVAGLAEAYAAYLTSSGVKEAQPALTKAKNRIFYTNFEVTRLGIWRNDKYAALFRAIDNAGGIYTSRWGDAAIHLLNVAAHVPAERTVRFDDVSYWHQYFVNAPAE